MTLERSTAWVVTCDTPNCKSIAVPNTAHTTRPQGRSGRYMLLAGKVDALTAAQAAGWVTGPAPDYRNYCPAHAPTTNT